MTPLSCGRVKKESTTFWNLAVLVDMINVGRNP